MAAAKKSASKRPSATRAEAKRARVKGLKLPDVIAKKVKGGAAKRPVATI